MLSLPQDSHGCGVQKDELSKCKILFHLRNNVKDINWISPLIPARGAGVSNRRIEGPSAACKLWQMGTKIRKKLTGIELIRPVLLIL